jgi:hypothetical protein
VDFLPRGKPPMPLIAFRWSKNCYIDLVTCTSKEIHISFNTKMHDPTLNICCWRQFKNMMKVLTHPPDSLELGPRGYHPPWKITQIFR